MSDAQSPPDVVVITARHEESVAAERAELLVTVQGSSLVTGRAALKKAKEVSALVEKDTEAEEDPAVTFYRVQALAAGRSPADVVSPLPRDRIRAPRLSEPWFC